MVLAPDMERRGSARYRTDITATVVLDDGRIRLSALMKNLSDTGARVCLPVGSGMSGDFYMLIPSHRLQPCRLVWRMGDEMGLAFID